MTSPAPPPGFTPFPDMGGYMQHSGPYCWAKDAAGEFIYGFQSDARHGNPNGVLHGGAIVAFVDTFLGHAVVMRTQKMCATVSLNSQFIAGAPIGGWIIGRARLRQTTRTLAFAEAEVMTGDTLLLTASGVFRIFEAR
jgi:uncharacterized protein (TIGR00369 family)